MIPLSEDQFAAQLALARHTIAPIEEASYTPLRNDQIFIPEWTDMKGAKVLFGFSRSFTYELIKRRKIRSISIRRTGATKGRRLIHCQSCRDFLAKCESEAAERNSEQIDAANAQVYNSSSAIPPEPLSRQIEAIRAENQRLAKQLAMKERAR